MCDVIHGGKIEVREQVDNMYPHLPADTRKNREAALVVKARRLYPWAPKRLAVQYGQHTDYYYYLTITLTVPDRVRAKAVEARLAAAEQARCACGDHGDWSCSLSGTSFDRPCAWAGCPNCSGQALGQPILMSDLRWYERYAGVTVGE